jgi:hypothetical protein
MKYVFDLPPELYERMNAVATQQNIDSVSAYLRQAIYNQLEIDTIPEGPMGSLSPAAGVGKASAERRDFDAVPLEARSIEWGRVGVARNARATSEPLWGQYNHFLPLKFACRVVASLSHSSGVTVPLDIVHDRGAKMAGRLRENLVELDHEAKRPRGGRWAAGFPTNDQKSLDRFAAQILGRVQRSGRTTGLVFDVGFIGIADEERRSVALTEAGVHFARLENPVLDGERSGDSPLSTRERGFLISHITTNLPEEATFLQFLVDAIASGCDTPESLGGLVRRKYSGWTEKVANTMRTGALGRLTDLGLVVRERRGSKVTYVATPEGMQFTQVGVG